MATQLSRAWTENSGVITGKRSKPSPPQNLMDGVGRGDFQKVGEELFKFLLECGQLKPESRILDVGCGCGRVAVQFMDYLSPEGGFWGVDIVRENISWCQDNISTLHRNFHFHLSDVYNKLYNPTGKFKAAEYRFPYQDNLFDLVVLTSVFTHMLTEDMKNYFGEISRVMKPGGRCVITFFILNDESSNLIRQGLSSFSFPFPEQDCRISNQEYPEAAVGYDESYIRQCFADQGLSIIEPIRFGNWCGRTKAFRCQDFIVASRI
jgi:ubiquinone/menaquinone biosynthesis C-methylase UbiE